jgi:hypothetical protein
LLRVVGVGNDSRKPAPTECLHEHLPPKMI